MHADGVGVQFPKMAHLGERGDADPEPLRRHRDRAGQLVQVCARLFVGQPDRNRLFVQVPTGRLFFDVQPRRDCSDPPANQFTYMSPGRNEVEAPSSSTTTSVLSSIQLRRGVTNKEYRAAPNLFLPAALDPTRAASATQ